MAANEALLQEWVAALRSNEYSQGRVYLRKDNNYCCLGVLCDLVCERVAGRWVQSAANGYYYFMSADENRMGSLPILVQDLLGTRSEGGRFIVTPELRAKFPKLPPPSDYTEERPCTLVDLNDKLGWNFSEIADLIEARPQGLFSQ